MPSLKVDLVFFLLKWPFSSVIVNNEAGSLQLMLRTRSSKLDLRDPGWYGGVYVIDQPIQFCSHTAAMNLLRNIFEVFTEALACYVVKNDFARIDRRQARIGRL